jgi:hypothetical protein
MLHSCVNGILSISICNNHIMIQNWNLPMDYVKQVILSVKISDIAHLN